MLQNATPLRKSAPGPPNNSDEHVSCIAPATENASLQMLFKCPTPAIVFENRDVLPTLDKVRNPLRLPRKTTSEPSKVVRNPSVLYILTSKCASRHNGVHFFDISTSKSGPNLVCFVHCDFEMCFEAEVLLTFSLANVLRATTACSFSTSQLLKVIRSWGVLYILTCKCASRHNGVLFFDIATSKSAPKLRCFLHFDLEMCFAPQRRAIFHLSSGQLAPFRDFPTFSRAWIFFLLTLSLSSSLLFSGSSHLSLLFICPYCRKFDC